MTVHITVEQRAASAASVEDLPNAIEEALAALDDINARYQRDRDGLQAWLGPERAKERLLAGLQARRKAEREPLVAWLLQLRASGEAAKAAAQPTRSAELV